MRPTALGAWMAMFALLIALGSCATGPAHSPQRALQLVERSQGNGVRIRPDSVHVEKGDTVQFSVDERLPLGSTRPRPVQITARGGSITQDGRFIAGRSIGVFHVIASSDDGSEADTATVVVTALRSHRTARSVHLRAHEPPNMRLFTERSFASRHEGGWLESSHNFQIVRDGSPRPGATDSLVGQIRFPAGFASGSAPAWTDREGLPSTLRFRTTYVSFWVKVSTNWYGQSVVNKIGFVWIGGKPKCDPAIQGGGTGPLYFQLRLQNLAGQADINLPNNLGPGTFSRGQWHHVELLLVANSASTAAADGQARWWLDDQPVGSATNIAWVGPGESDTWETFAWNPIWGGAGGTIPADQYMWMDQYYASGK
jgi:hypothetical protein